MQDLEENARIINNIKNKLEDLGDSLWHHKFRKHLKRIRKQNNWSSVFGKIARALIKF